MTNAARSSCGMPDGLEQLAVARAALGLAARRLRRGSPTGTRAARESRERVASSTRYSLRTTSSPAAGAFGGEDARARSARRARRWSSAGSAGRACASSVASLSTTRRSRGATSAKYSSRGRPRLPSAASSSWSRSATSVAHRIRDYPPSGSVGARNIPATRGMVSDASCVQSQRSSLSDTVRPTGENDEQRTTSRCQPDRRRTRRGRGAVVPRLPRRRSRPRRRRPAGAVGGDRASWPRREPARRSTSTAARTSGST